ncbi:hypothetical protein WJX73_004983 [Symbiochloris irregularis]|uniref:Uncharacterized protein n=1 Tax=Symbiochloris irregularis TaxID=706552 RepID=A0AAW1NZA0_9CHLO
MTVKFFPLQANVSGREIAAACAMIDLDTKERALRNYNYVVDRVPGLSRWFGGVPITPTTWPFDNRLKGASKVSKEGEVAAVENECSQ